MGCCGGVRGQGVRVQRERGWGVDWIRQCDREGGCRQGGVVGRGVKRGVGLVSL